METTSNEDKENTNVGFCMLLQCLAKDMRKLVRNLNSPRAAWEMFGCIIWQEFIHGQDTRTPPLLLPAD